MNNCPFEYRSFLDTDEILARGRGLVKKEVGDEASTADEQAVTRFNLCKSVYFTASCVQSVCIREKQCVILG